MRRDHLYRSGDSAVAGGSSPLQAYQLAANYQLGRVEKRHSPSLIKLIILFAGIVTLVFVGGQLFLPILSGQVQSGLLVTVVPLVVVTLVTGAIIVYGLLPSREAYECSGGFVIVRGRRKRVELALTWGQLTNAWRVVRQSDGHEYPRYYISYQDFSGGKHSYKVFSVLLWRRCYIEVHHIEPPASI